MSKDIREKSIQDLEEIEKKKRLSSQEREKDRHAWALVMNLKEGRRVIRNILSMCGLYRSSFTGNSETFKLEGQRNIGLTIKRELENFDLENLLHLLNLEGKNKDKAKIFEDFLNV